MKRTHLSPKLYSTLQSFVHRGHRKTFEVILDLLGLSPGETVVEVGCGTGLLARHFVDHGYDYWGIELDSNRVAVAERLTPEAHFIVADATSLEHVALPLFQRAFTHQVLHHLDDSKSRRIIDHILSFGPDVRMAVIEPFRPDRWYFNPLWTLFANLDEGKSIRTLQCWRGLYGSNLEAFTTRSLWPRWPVSLVDARLVARTPAITRVHPDHGKPPSNRRN